jgi:hypothetical protein
LHAHIGLLKKAIRRRQVAAGLKVVHSDRTKPAKDPDRRMTVDMLSLKASRAGAGTIIFELLTWLSDPNVSRMDPPGGRLIRTHLFHSSWVFGFSSTAVRSCVCDVPQVIESYTG